MAGEQVSKQQMQDLVVITAFLEFLKTVGSIPHEVSSGEAFDNLREILVWAPTAEHPYWSCEVGGGSGPLAQLHARGAVRFAGNALDEALRGVKSLDDGVPIPAGTQVVILPE